MLRICLRIFHPLLHRFPVAQILQPLQPLGLHHLLPQGLLTLRQGPLILPLHLQPGRAPPDPIRIQFSVLRIYRYQLRIPCFLLQWPHIIRPSLTLPPQWCLSLPWCTLTLPQQPRTRRPPVGPIRTQLFTIRIYICLYTATLPTFLLVLPCLFQTFHLSPQPTILPPSQEPGPRVLAAKVGRPSTPLLRLSFPAPLPPLHLLPLPLQQHLPLHSLQFHSRHLPSLYGLHLHGLHLHNLHLHNLHLHSLHLHSFPLHNLHLHSLHLHLHSLHLHSLHPLALLTPPRPPGGRMWPSRPSGTFARIFHLLQLQTASSYAALQPGHWSWPWRPETGLR